jgi:hypothetical protein
VRARGPGQVDHDLDARAIEHAPVFGADGGIDHDRVECIELADHVQIHGPLQMLLLGE